MSAKLGLKRPKGAKAAGMSAVATAEAAKKRRKHDLSKFGYMLAAVLGIAAVAVWFFGVRTAIATVRQNQENVVKLNAECVKMRQVISEGEKMPEEIKEMVARREACSDAFLEPQLGSYAMQAKAILEPISDALELGRPRFENIAETVSLPATEPKAQKPYVRRRVRMTVSGSYQKLSSFLCHVERLHPGIVTEAVSIKPSGEGAKQVGTFVFCWLSLPDDGSEVKQ